MSPRRRVAITGIGIVSPLGRGAAANLEAVREGQSGISRLQNIDTSDLICKIGGEVPVSALEGTSRDLDRTSRLALIAAAEAAAQSRLDELPERARIATLLGTGLGGSESMELAYHRLYAEGQSRLAPATIPRAMYNAATSAVSSRHQALGPAFTTVSACASAAHAIGQAAHWIRFGMADVVITGGADAPLFPGVLRGWEALRILSPDNDHPASACRPFSRDRKGLVLAEGAAVLILEELESARCRGIPLLGEILGSGMSSDAAHVTDPSADGAVRAMRQALEDGEVNLDEVGYVNAHGTATRANDRVETAALHMVFGTRSGRIPVSSTKSMHGHAMGATGAIELVLSLLALNSGFLPPTINYREQDPDCDLDYVPNEAREADVRTFLSNSFGFGGMNGVLAARTSRAVK